MFNLAEQAHEHQRNNNKMQVIIKHLTIILIR